jgi:hypothetical protein
MHPLLTNGCFDDSLKVHMSLQVIAVGKTINISVTKALINEFREFKIFA